MESLDPAANAASIALRHFSAYADLIADDVGSARAALARRFFAGVVLAGSALLSVVMAGVWAIALTWDTAARLPLIAGLFGVFFLTSLTALVVLMTIQHRQRGRPSRTGLEWQKDRALLEALLMRTHRGAG